jgi:hypothetical protein
MPKLSKDNWDFRALRTDYVDEVLKNMPNTGDPLATLRFGTSGDGVQPNYEIRTGGGERLPYWGNTHKQNKDRSNWEDHNLTEPFSRTEVERGFDISLKSVEVAKKYILSKFKRDPKKYPRPDAKLLPQLIAAVMNGTPIEKAFEDLSKIQNNARDPSQSPST